MQPYFNIDGNAFLHICKFHVLMKFAYFIEKRVILQWPNNVKNIKTEVNKHSKAEGCNRDRVLYI